MSNHFKSAGTGTPRHLSEAPAATREVAEWGGYYTTAKLAENLLGPFWTKREA